VTLETLRDLCAKFQPHTIFFKVRAFFELIPTYYNENINANRSEESENTKMNNDIISAKRQTVYDSIFALKQAKIDHDKVDKNHCSIKL